MGRAFWNIGSAPKHGLSSNAVPGGVWQVGREVAEKRGRSHIRKVLQETGSLEQRNKWQICTLDHLGGHSPLRSGPRSGSGPSAQSSRAWGQVECSVGSE